jgi:hypothetical protein
MMMCSVLCFSRQFNSREIVRINNAFAPKICMVLVLFVHNNLITIKCYADIAAIR